MTLPTQNRMITKEQIKGVASLWDNKTAREIGEDLNLDKFQIMRIAMMLRQAGMNLPKKHKKGVLRNLVLEVVAELQPQA